MARNFPNPRKFNRPQRRESPATSYPSSSCSPQFMNTADDESDDHSISYKSIKSSIDNESINSVSSQLSSISLYSTNRFLLNTYRVGPYVRDLGSFIEIEKKKIYEEFQKERVNILNKKQLNYFQTSNEKFEDKSFTLTREALEADEKVLMMQYESFNKELERLASINNTDNRLLKYAYEREFKRAQNRLPFYGFRSEILDSLAANDVIVVIGETGSGKTTQVVQYLLESGLAGRKKIVCTQPRKFVTVSVAKRVSEELICPEDCTLVTHKSLNNFQDSRNQTTDARQNKLIFMTDKSLLSEYRRNKKLIKYSCVVVDEAHERTIFTDILLCELKQLVKKRRADGYPLKLIIMSATIDENKFATYFDNCPIIRVPGRLYPIKTFFEKEPRKDYLNATVDKVKYILKNTDRKNQVGDILVFLPSLDDIRKATRYTKEYLNKNASQFSNKFEVFELYGQMEPDEQMKVFKNIEGKSKVIFSTNVAETSVTINGVRTVIDSGRVKEKIYDQERNISILKLKLITKSSSTQRKGRAGRCAPGTCYFLYTEEEYDNMEDMIRPEILRMHLGSVVLQLMACGVENVIEYNLLDKPDINALKTSIDKLKSLNLITDDNKITENGRLAAELYLEPSISRMIIEALEFGVGDQGIRIAAMMSVSNNLYSKQANLKDKLIKQLNISSCHGDFITLLNIFNEFKHTKYKHRKEWCDQNEYSFSALKLAEQAYFDLFTIVRKLKVDISKKLVRMDFGENRQDQSHEQILRAICAGFHANLAYFNGKSYDGSNVYKLVELNQEAFINNESVLYVLDENDLDKRFLLFGDLIRNEKLYMKNITPVKLDMLAEYSKKDYSHIEISTKEILKESLNSIISSMFQERNGELLESIEEKLGYAVRIKENQLETYVASGDFTISRQVVESFIELVKSRIKNEVLNYRVDNNVRAILKGGLEVHTLLFPNEFIKLNFMDFDGERESLIKIFRKYGVILDLVDFKSGTSSSKRSGFVVYENCEDAKKAFDELQYEITINPSIAMEEQMSLRNSTLKAFWYLTEPTGTAFIELEPNRLNIIRAINILTRLGYRSKPASDSPNKIIVNNALKNNSNMDETTFKAELLPYIPGIQSCSFIRKDPTNTNIMIDVESLIIKSLFEQCGEIKTIDIMPYGISKAGKLKPQTTVEVKYNSFESVTKAIDMFDNKPLPNGLAGFGNMHLSTNFINEFKLPKKALDLYDMEYLKALILNSFKSSIFVDEKLDKYENTRISVKSKDQKSLEEVSAFLDNIIKPVTISLPYFQYDKLRKILNKGNYQKNLENEYHIHISKDARINQIKIYGNDKSIGEKVRKELEMNLDKSGGENKYVEIKLHSLKVVLKNNGEIYKTLCDEFRGEINLNFKEKAIRLTSKESQLDTFKNRIEKLNQDYLKENKNIKTTNSAQSCAICMEEIITNCVTLTLCSHRFCKECLESQFNTFDISQKLDCVVCGTEISLADLKCLGNHEEMQKKCSIALSKFMTNNPRFRYCDGGCNLVMKLTSNQKEAWCDNCRKRESTKKADESYNDYMDHSKTTKKCPKCSIPIEKNDGCNHMTCSVCNSHFCWTCLFVANDSKSIYDHLNSTHGGAFDIPLNFGL